MATLAKPMPSASSATSKVMRPAPVSRSEPTMDNNRPVRTMATALSTDPLASTTAKIRPSTMSEKYSPGPALPRHLMTVEAGDHRSRLSRDVDQHRGGRAAVLRAVINAGEHDQGAD